MSRLSQIIQEETQSLTEADALRVLDFINALKVSAAGVGSPDGGVSPSGTRARPGVALVEQSAAAAATGVPEPGTAAAALALLATPRFRNGPVGAADEVQQRIEALRQDWDHD